jgi:hypothetical protein
MYPTFRYYTYLAPKIARKKNLLHTPVSCILLTQQALPAPAAGLLKFGLRHMPRQTFVGNPTACWDTALSCTFLTQTSPQQPRGAPLNSGPRHVFGLTFVGNSVAQKRRQPPV